MPAEALRLNIFGKLSFVVIIVNIDVKIHKVKKLLVHFIVFYLFL